MKALALNPDAVARRSLERWENEGGRIRLGTEMANLVNLSTNGSDRHHDLSKNASVAGLGSLVETVADFGIGFKERSTDMTKNKCAIVLLGPPGSGKTTLVRSLATGKRLAAIEAGNLLKREVRLQTPLGRQIKPYTDSGVLVPSALVTRVISAEAETVENDLVLFDGFPRCSEQIELFFQMLKELQLHLGAVLVLTLDMQTAVERLSGRRICANCGSLYNQNAKPPIQTGKCDECGGDLVQREDDRAEVIQRRFTSYERETIPVIEFFRARYEHLIWQQSATAAFPEIIARAGRRLGELARP